MTRYPLATHIISNIVKPQPSQTLLTWRTAQRDDDLFISSLAAIPRMVAVKERYHFQATSGYLSICFQFSAMKPRGSTFKTCAVMRALFPAHAQL